MTVASSSDARFDVASVRVVLQRLREVQRELDAAHEAERVAALQRVRVAVGRLGALGSPEGVLERSASELGLDSRFDRVLVSGVRDGVLLPHTLWQRDDPTAADVAIERLRRWPIAVEYPLVEAEVVRDRGSRVVDVTASGPRTPRALIEVLACTSYVVVALTLGGRTIGLLHADAGASAVDETDAELAFRYGEGLTSALERAALRETLRRHRDEMRVAVQRFGTPVDVPGGDDSAEGNDAARAALAALTQRELEILQLLARGRTNGSIAKDLLISESTVKYHVKNILRKLQASSRADAVARYLRGGA